MNIVHSSFSVGSVFIVRPAMTVVYAAPPKNRTPHARPRQCPPGQTAPNLCTAPDLPPEKLNQLRIHKIARVILERIGPQAALEHIILNPLRCIERVVPLAADESIVANVISLIVFVRLPA